MKKYHYEFFVYTNNMCNGYGKVSNGYRTKTAAEFACYNYFLDKYGCCDIVKRRVYDN